MDGYIMVLAAVVIGLLIWLLPLLLIWCFNTLFSLAITYNFINWLASFLLITLLGGTSSARK